MIVISYRIFKKRTILLFIFEFDKNKERIRQNFDEKRQFDNRILKQKRVST